MGMRRLSTGFLARASVCVLLAALFACSDQTATLESSIDDDVDLQNRVQAVLASAADLPGSALQVEVADGQVTVRGSLDCEDCGGTGTPAGSGTVQQSLGAVLRAVPGVTEVVFQLQ